MKRWLWVCTLCAGGLAAAAAEVDLTSFQIDRRLKMEVFAAEPDVVDPVALTFDEAGRMYVVEMRDYPYGIEPGRRPGGTIRLLEDLDHDGKADKSTIFARDLSFPTSIAPWDGGVFVTAPPEIIYLKDTNGDGVADLREVYFSGFVLGVTDSNVNGLRWGLDNRLHGINGGNGGNVKPEKGTRISVDLGDADFAFDPRNATIAPTYQTSGGFGLVFDEFGRSFSTHNINHIQQRIIPLRYLERFAGMLPVEPTVSISDHGEMARIYPISIAQTRPNHPEQAGHFSSSGGLGFIGYDAYPEDLYRSVTVGDVVGNLLHRDLLEMNGAIYTARRAASETNREFVASRDGSCRMTGLELGPDGALYVIDMQRDVIEHPDYIPEKVRAKQNIRAGDDRGRVYRLTPEEGLPKERTLDLSKASPEQLVAELTHHNQWRRMTAQRLLVQRREAAVAPKIAEIATRHPFAPARVQALWTLLGIGRMDMGTIGRALLADEPEVRENAVQVLERFSGGGGRGMPGSLAFASMLSFQNMIPKLLQDPSPRVKFQLALTLGEMETPEANSNVVKLLIENRESYWIRVAAYSSLRGPMDALTAMLKAASATNAVDLEVVRDLADLAVVRTDLPTSRLTEVLAVAQRADVPLARAALEGLERGYARRSSVSIRVPVGPALIRLAERDEMLFEPVWSLQRRLGLAENARQKERLAKAVATVQSDGERGERLQAMQLLRFGEYKTVKEALLSQLNGRADAEVQRAALRVLSNYRETDLAERLVQRWPELSPSLRGPVLQLLLSRRSFHEPLVSALEKGQLKVGELNLDLEQRRILLRRSTPEIKARAEKFISDEEYSNRKTVVDDWLKKLPERGDAAKGRAVFEKSCAQCHRAGGLGNSVGPDLSSVSHRSVEDLLFNILDPSMAINPKYTAYNVETSDGELITGILERDSPESVTLLQAGAAKAVVPRGKMKSMRASGASLMPEGLEAGFTPADLRDLIAFLQQ